MLKELFERVLKEYKSARNENFVGHPIANILRNELPGQIRENIDNSDKYKVSGSAGQGNWTYSPWVAILNKEITESPQKGYYLVYLFREDMEGVYLSLNQGMTEIKNQYGTARTKEILKSKASEFREKLGESPELLNSIDLKAINSSSNSLFYEEGNIYAKYYDLQDLPSDERLQSDLNEMLSLYHSINGRNENFISDDTDSRPNKWILVTKDPENWEELEQSEQTTWSGNENMKDGDILLMYNTSPRSRIDFIFKAKGDSYHDSFFEEEWNSPAVDICQKIKIPNPVTFREMSKNEILKEWNAIKIRFMGTVFDVPEDKWLEIKKLIIKKNPELKSIINQMDSNEISNDKLTPENLEDIDSKDYYDIDAGRAHIVRDICYLISINDNLTEENLSNIINSNIKDDKYWIAYYQRGNPKNKPKYNLNSARTLNLVETKKLELTNLGKELVNNISEAELFTHHYSLDVKRFFYQLALTYDNIKVAMDILKEEKKLRFYSPICNLTNKVMWQQHKDNEKYHCDENFDKNCENCNRDVEEHIKETSLPFETYKLTNNKRGFVFWMTSRVTPMHLTGSDPAYSGRFIYWDLEAEKELEEVNNPYKHFTEFLSSKGFYFEPETIENFLLSLKVKPFVILTGNSGTGKTKLVQLFSEYLAFQNGQCHKIVPIGANWTENRHIIGFYNVITDEYMTSDALELIIEASKPENKDKPYFLILDEMNLSHVERYFADFLSAMESGEHITLHKSDEEEKYPKKVKIPKNLFVIGTVNVDETTYMFSPKVLDRANVIEFSTIPVKNYMLNGFNPEELNGNAEYIENPLSDLDIRKYRIEDIRKHLVNVETNEGILWDVLSDELNKFQEVLKKAGFDFGFRVIDEILRFIYVAWIYEGKEDEWNGWERYFDAQIKQKMIPKIHGSQRTLENVIKELFELCLGGESEKAPRSFGDILSKNVKYSKSALKIQEMDKVLYEQRYVSFIN